ncbi:MAG: phospholipase/carboxylesterase, partial [Flavobacteriales bacterium]
MSMSEHALPYVEINPKSQAKATVIWLHGLGDSGNGFAP